MPIELESPYQSQWVADRVNYQDECISGTLEFPKKHLHLIMGKTLLSETPGSRQKLGMIWGFLEFLRRTSSFCGMLFTVYIKVTGLESWAFVIQIFIEVIGSQSRHCKFLPALCHKTTPHYVFTQYHVAIDFPIDTCYKNPTLILFKVPLAHGKRLPWTGN